MKVTKKISILFFITLVCVIFDQGTKLLAIEYLSAGQYYSYVSDMLRIEYVENRGAFLGIGSNLPDVYRFWLLVVFVGLFLIGLLIYIVASRTQGLGSLSGFSFIFSGGVSNFYDRLTNDGAVIDFLNVGIGWLRTGIFNVADMAVMLGMAMIIIYSFKDSKAANDK